MARQPRTPGATETPKTTETEVATTTTADQADAALNAILGTPDTTDSTESTSTASEPVAIEPTAEELAERKEYEEFQAWRKSKGQDAAKSVEPVAQHVPASGVPSEPVAKRTRQFCGPDGWTSEEY